MDVRPMSTHEHANEHGNEPHGDSLGVYLAVFAALMVLLVITVVVSFFHFGNTINPMIAMTIAIIKAALVIIFFMHVRHQAHLVWVFAGGSFFFLAILLYFVMSDAMTRDWRDSSGRSLTQMEVLPGPFELLMKDGETYPPVATESAPK